MWYNKPIQFHFWMKEAEMMDEMVRIIFIFYWTGIYKFMVSSLRDERYLHWDLKKCQIDYFTAYI